MGVAPATYAGHIHNDIHCLIQTMDADNGTVQYMCVPRVLSHSLSPTHQGYRVLSSSPDTVSRLDRLSAWYCRSVIHVCVYVHTLTRTHAHTHTHTHARVYIIHVERRHLPCINFEDLACPAELPRWLSWYSVCLAERCRFKSCLRQLFFFSWGKERVVFRRHCLDLPRL